MNPIQTFVEVLATTPAPDDAFNQYSYVHPGNAARRHNLTQYLTQMQAQRPKVLLVAEAPGYRGARLTGVPFTSRHIIAHGVEGVPLFGKGYMVPDDADNPAQKEATATIVWGVIHKMRPLPLSWNSFPFHPHQPDKPLSNRKPRQPEIAIGKQFLTQIMTLFPVTQVVAVGNTAKDTLNHMGIVCEKVRHPAQGGKNDFVAGMQRLVN